MLGFRRGEFIYHRTMLPCWSRMDGWMDGFALCRLGHSRSWKEVREKFFFLSLSLLLLCTTGIDSRSEPTSVASKRTANNNDNIMDLNMLAGISHVDDQ